MLQDDLCFLVYFRNTPIVFSCRKKDLPKLILVGGVVAKLLRYIVFFREKECFLTLILNNSLCLLIYFLQAGLCNTKYLETVYKSSFQTLLQFVRAICTY